MTKKQVTVWLSPEAIANVELLRVGTFESFSHAVDRLIIGHPIASLLDEDDDPIEEYATDPQEGQGVVFWLIFSFGCLAAFAMGVAIGMAALG